MPDHAPADPRGDKVTARHVLSHSSGYRNWRQAGQTLIPEFDPGTRFQYSGEGFYYLQRALESVERKGFEQVMLDLTLVPFGMQASTFAWRQGFESRVVTGHTRGVPVRQPSRDFAARLLQFAIDRGRPLRSFTHADTVAAMAAAEPSPPALPNYMLPNAAGSLLTTVRDYAAFMEQVLEVEDMQYRLAAATRQAMITPSTRLNSVLSWGLGWGIERGAGREYIWHWGDNGPFKNFVLAHPVSKSGVVVFTNGSNGLRVCEAIVESAAGQAIAAFDWV